MLTINQALNLKAIFILSYDKSQGLLCDSEREIIGIDDEYLGDLTIQYHSLVDDACISFTIEVLVQEYNNKVSIEQMNTCEEAHNVYVNNIESLPNGSHYIWAHDTDETLHETLKDLIENQPIYDAPEHFIIESY